MKKTLLERQGLKIMLSVILLYVLIFTIPIISAIELNPFANKLSIEKNAVNIDNVFLKETFNSKYGSIKISSTFFWFSTDKIAEYTLTGTTEQCLINCQSEGRAVLYQDGKLFDDVNFKDIKGNIINLKDVQYYIKVSETYEEDMPNYKRICDGDKCSNIIDGYVKSSGTREYWKPYNFENLKVGNYEWKIEGKKPINKNIDFIPIAQGRSLDEWVWWDASWSKRRLISINTTNATSLENLSVLLAIDKYTGMEADFASMRFVNGSETGELGYWIYNNTLYNSTMANVYIMLDTNISASNNYTMYLYYNNPAVTTTSNISNAFLFADDFNSLTLDLNKWTPTTPAGLSQSNGWLNMTTANNWGRKGFDNVEIVTRRKTNLLASGKPDWYFSTRNGASSNDILLGNGLWRTYIDGGLSISAIAYTVNTSYINKISVDTDGNVAINITDDTGLQLLARNGTTTTYKTNISIMWNYLFGGIDAINEIDWVYIKRYSATEPTYTIGTEATSGATIILTTTLTSPDNGYSSLNTLQYFNVSYIINGGNITNTTLYVWYNNGTLFGKNVTILTGTTNSTNSSINLNYGNFIWNYRGCAENSTSYLCEMDVLNRTINIFSGIINSYNYSNSSYETDLSHFDINITSNSITPTNIKLIYNGTSYDGNLTSIGGNDYRLTSGIYIPLTTSQSIENKTWYFSFNISGVVQTSTIINQTVNPIRLGLCNTTLNVTYINFTFKDESTTTNINETFNSLFTYYLSNSDGSIKRSLSYISNIYNESYPFCFTPVNRNITVNMTISYYGDGYPLRTFTNKSISLVNNSYNQILYSVSLISGIYTTFQVINQANQPISGVYTTAEVQVGGIWITIGTGTTGDDGGVTFFVDPNYQHRFTFSKIGYDTYITTITPTSSSYTITLGGISAGGTILDYNKGISYSLTPIDSTLYNMTNYQFSFNMHSTYWNLDSWGFNLLGNKTNLVGANSSTTGTGGIIYINVSTGQNKSIVMNYWWIINSTHFNGTKTWTVVNGFDDSWSIKNFFDDLKTYTDAGIFGLDAFGRTLIIFLIIFLIIGAISYSSGTYSIGAILVELSVLVYLFDWVLELIPNPSPFKGFPTILVGLITIGYLIQEWRK